MKVRTRILLLLLLVAGVFVVSMTMMRLWQAERIEAFQQRHALEVRRLLDRLLELQSKSLYTYVYDYTIWDEMASFVTEQAPEWAKENLEQSLPTYNAQALWVFSPDYEEVYACALEEANRGRLPFPVGREQMPRLFSGDGFARFFAQSEEGLIEVRGTGIRATADSARSGQIHGYFFVGRLWNSRFLGSLSELLGCRAALLPPFDVGGMPDTVLSASKNILTYHPLLGWDGAAVSVLEVETDNPLAAHRLQVGVWQPWVALVFALLSVTLFLVFFTRWVAAPMRIISGALRSKDLSGLERLRGDSSEFGYLARLIADYFEQRDTLEREVETRTRIATDLTTLEDSFKTLLDATNDWVFLTDIKGRFIAANRAVCRALNLSVEALNEHNVFDYIGQERVETRRAQIAYVVRTASSVRMEAAFNHRNYDVGVYPVINAEGEVFRIAFFGHDITERRQMEEQRLQLEAQLRQSQKIESVGRLAGGIAHDFNNLLSPILGYAELALDQIPKEEPLHEDVEQIRAAAYRARDLTRQLLAFSRKQVLEVKVLNLNEIIIDIESMLRRLIGEDIQVVTQLAATLENVKADPAQIQQIVLNLAVNARDAMPQGGILTIETANVLLDEQYASLHAGMSAGRYVLLAISDNGCGMTAEVKQRLFEPFFTTKERGKGTGLGLATVYGIVKQHGGNIWVYSEAGQGTTVKVYFPYVTSEAEAVERITAPKASCFGTETILVVEDDEMVRRLAYDVLTAHGYNVLLAASGEYAITLLGQLERPIDLLLTDVIMPTMNGKELHARLMEEYPDLKVIYMSGYTGEVIAHHGILETGTHFIPKPFTIQEVTSKVREVLDGTSKTSS